MEIIEIFLIGLALGMDSFTVSLCKGLSMEKMNWRKAIVIGLYFGIFQALMPVIGYVLGEKFERIITNIDHWIAFIILSIIGINMIRETLKQDREKGNDKVDFKTMLPLAVATSIDALAVGITFSFLNTNIMLAVSIIGMVALSLSIIGVKIGNVFGDKYKKGAETFGGTILILIGLKILLEHIL